MRFGTRAPAQAALEPWQRRPAWVLPRNSCEGRRRTRSPIVRRSAEASGQPRAPWAEGATICSRSSPLSARPRPFFSQRPSPEPAATEESPPGRGSTSIIVSRREGGHNRGAHLLGACQRPVGRVERDAVEPARDGRLDRGREPVLDRAPATTSGQQRQRQADRDQHRQDRSRPLVDRWPERRSKLLLRFGPCCADLFGYRWPFRP
jgi:hypothetical protein